MGLLRGRKNLSRIWPLPSYMQGHFLIIFGLRHLIVSNTSRNYPLTDLSRIILFSRLGMATNQKSPTFVSLDHEHGVRFPLRRVKN
jgi:hypothetical protein